MVTGARQSQSLDVPVHCFGDERPNVWGSASVDRSPFGSAVPGRERFGDLGSCVANGKTATAAVTRCGYRRGEFFGGYELRREDQDGPTALPWQVLRRSNPEKHGEPQDRLQAAIRLQVGHGANRRGGAKPRGRSALLGGTGRPSEWQHSSLAQPRAMMSMEGRTDESQERRLVLSCQANLGASKRRQGHEGANIG